MSCVRSARPASNGKVAKSGNDHVSVCVLVPFGGTGSGVDDDVVVVTKSAGDESIRVRSKRDRSGSTGDDAEVLADGGACRPEPVQEN
jgi:hypothetical protein